MERVNHRMAFSNSDETDPPRSESDSADTISVRVQSPKIQPRISDGVAGQVVQESRPAKAGRPGSLRHPDQADQKTTESVKR